MPINKRFEGNIALTAKSLDVRSERQGLIQSNIANIETPGYKVQEFSFENVMESVMTDRGRLDRTHPKHMALDPIEISEGLEATIEDRPVDLDEEMLKLAENQLMYRVATKIISKKLEGMKLAIDEGGK